MPSALYRLLGDEVRLRLLRLLALERLNVTELTGILGIAQSGVSRHLGLLKDGGLVERGARGRIHLLRDRRPTRGGSTATARSGRCSRSSSSGAARHRRRPCRQRPARRGRRLRQENFDDARGPDANERQLVPGRSWAAWARALGHLLPPLRVADLGCGEGYLTIEAEPLGVAASSPSIDRPTC